MRCPNCGHELEKGSGFCESCGMILSLDNTGRETTQGTQSNRRKIKPNFDDDFVEYLEFGEDDNVPKKVNESERYSYEDEQGESEETADEDAEADYSESEDEEDREEDSVYAENEYYNLSRSHIDRDDEASADEEKSDRTDNTFSEILEDDEDEELDEEDDDRDMYVKRTNTKKTVAAVASLAVILIVVIAVGVTIIKGNFKPAVAPGASTESSDTQANNAVEPTMGKTDPTESTTEEKTTQETTQEKTTQQKTTKEETTTKAQASTQSTTQSSTTARAVIPGTTSPQTSTTAPHTTAASTTAPSTTKVAETPEKYTIADIQSKKPSKYLSSPYRTQITSHGCHMRSGPGTSYDHVLYFSQGDTVKVLAKENGFLYVYAERYGVYGWVSSSLTGSSNNEPTEKTTESTSSAPTRVISPDKTYKNPETKKATAAEGLKLRFGPGTEYDALRLIAKDTSVVVKGYSTKSSGWVYVTVPSYGVSGWVSSAYIK